MGLNSGFKGLNRADGKSNLQNNYRESERERARARERECVFR